MHICFHSLISLFSFNVSNVNSFLLVVLKLPRFILSLLLCLYEYSTRYIIFLLSILICVLRFIIAMKFIIVVIDYTLLQENLSNAGKSNPSAGIGDCPCYNLGQNIWNKVKKSRKIGQ